MGFRHYHLAEVSRLLTQNLQLDNKPFFFSKTCSEQARELKAYYDEIYGNNEDSVNDYESDSSGDSSGDSSESSDDDCEDEDKQQGLFFLCYKIRFLSCSHRFLHSNYRNIIL